jgi:ubiquinol-cytochrome c reductase cytochrome c subunit
MRALLFVILAAAAAAQTKSGAAPVGDVQNGKKIFTSYGCYQCHGYDGHGGAGARLAPNAISFEAFSKYVRQPAGEMPPYTSKVVSEKELADIYAFLHTLPAPPKSVPLLSGK